MVLSFAVNQGAPIQTGSGVPLESRGVVDTGCETSSGYTSATGNMMGGSRKSRRQYRSKKSSSRKDRKDRKDRKEQRTKRRQKSRQQLRKRQQRHLNRTLKSHKIDYEQEGGGASYSQILNAAPYGDALGSQGAMRSEVALAKTD